MDAEGRPNPRLATIEEASEIAQLLHDFNLEFGDPTPGVAALAARLRVLLAQDTTVAIVAGRPAVGVALVTLRSNVWYTGQVALLDEMYVVPQLRGRGIGSGIIQRLLATCSATGIDLIEINVDEGDIDAQRFYQRHGFTSSEPGSTERSFYFWQEISS